jgi:hypothetical protein
MQRQQSGHFERHNRTKPRRRYVQYRSICVHYGAVECDATVSFLLHYQRYQPPCTVSLVSLRTLAAVKQGSASRKLGSAHPVHNDQTGLPRHAGPRRRP